MQQALDALELPCDRWNKQQHMIVMKASDALRAELAKPEPGPVGWLGRQGQYMSNRHYVVSTRKSINIDFIPLYRKEDV
jgi:hypothetical protein